MSLPGKKSAPGFGEESQARKHFECAERKLKGTELQLLSHWYDHAESIAHDFNRTGDARHLRAFCRQVIGILSAVERSLPR